MGAAVLRCPLSALLRSQTVEAAATSPSSLASKATGYSSGIHRPAVAAGVKSSTRTVAPGIGSPADVVPSGCSRCKRLLPAIVGCILHSDRELSAASYAGFKLGMRDNVRCDRAAPYGRAFQLLSASRINRFLRRGVVRFRLAWLASG